MEQYKLIQYLSYSWSNIISLIYRQGIYKLLIVDVINLIFHPKPQLFYITLQKNLQLKSKKISVIHHQSNFSNFPSSFQTLSTASTTFPLPIYLFQPLLYFQNNIQNTMQALSIFKHYDHTNIKDPMHSLLYTLAICLASIYFGYTLIYLSAIDFPVIAAVYSIDYDLNLAQGIFQGVIPMGGAVGAASSAFFVSILSRRYPPQYARHLIIVFNLIAATLCLLTLYTDYRVFLLVRFLQGACAGLFSSVVPMVVKENAPMEMASITGTIPNLLIIFGLFFLYLMQFVLGLISGDMSGASTWKVIFLFPVVLLLAQSWLLWKVYPYQTIKYLAVGHKTSQLKSLLRQFYREEAVQQLCSQNLKIYSSGTSSSVQKETYNSKSAIIFGLFFAILCPFAGINVLVSYCGDVAAKIFPSLKNAIGALLMLAFCTFSGLSMVFVGRFGRKDMTIWGTYGIAFTLYCITTGYFLSQEYPLVAQMMVFFSMVVYLFVYGMTFAPIMWMFLAQALQPSKIGYAVMLNWIGAAIIMIFFPLAQAIVPNQGYIFGSFATFTLLSVFVTKKLMLQTKDKTDSQIQHDYKLLDMQIWGSVEETKQTEMSLLNKQNIQ